MRVFRRLSPLFEIANLLFIETAVKNTLSFQTHTRNVNAYIRYNRIVVKVSFTIGFLIATFYAYAGLYPLSLLTLLLLASLFGLSFSYGYFNLDVSYLHTFLTREEVAKAKVIGFFRFYDWPAVVGLLSYCLAVAIGNPAGLIAAIPSYLSVLAFSITIVVLLSKKATGFHSAGSLKGTAIRIASMAVWFFSMYGGYVIFYFFNSLYRLSVPEKYWSAFPLTYGFWIAEPFNSKYAALSLVYMAITAVIFRFALKSLQTESATKFYGSKGEWKIRIRRKMVAVVIKDLKQLFRSPQLLVIALLPFFNSLGYLYFKNFFHGVPGVLNMQIMLALTAAALVSLERSSYTSTLPLSQLEMKLGKVYLGLIIYLISLTLFLIIQVYRGGNPAHVLSIAPSGIAVVLVGVQMSQNSANDPINANAILAVLISLLIVIIPVISGAFADFVLKKPFHLYAFPISAVETAVVAFFFFAYNRRD